MLLPFTLILLNAQEYSPSTTLEPHHQPSCAMSSTLEPILVPSANVSVVVNSPVALSQTVFAVSVLLSRAKSICVHSSVPSARVALKPKLPPPPIQPSPGVAVPVNSTVLISAVPRTPTFH